jgi:transposase InsO family protein
VTTDSNQRQPVAPNVLDRRFDGWNLNRAWVSDITYISTVEGWLYLAVVMDLASRRIVGWSMSPPTPSRAGLPGAASGLLATQTGAGTDHAFRPRQPVRE